MKSDRQRRRLYILMALATLFLLKPSAYAQTVANDQRAPGTSTPSEKKRTTSVEPSASKDDVEQLKSKVDQLLLLVERQERAMAEMEKRLNSVEGSPRKVAPVSASLKLAETASATAAPDAKALTTDA